MAESDSGSIPPASSSAKTDDAQTGRVFGLDVAKGVAILAMFPVHIFAVFHGDGSPTLTTVVEAGRAATLFAFVAGINLALVSGRQRLPTGRDLALAKVGIAGRAVALALIGFVVTQIDALGGNHAAIILVFFAMTFLLAAPLIGLRTRSLFLSAGALALVGPVVRFLLSRVVSDGIPGGVPWFTDLANPLAVLAELFLYGSYPVTGLLVFVLAGMATGRLALASVPLAKRMLLAGTAAAVVSWVSASVLLFNTEALDRLATVAPPGYEGEAARTTALWFPAGIADSWWVLVQRAGHSASTFDVVGTLGCASAVVGLCLMVSRKHSTALLLTPVAAAGSMPLTVYSLHIVFLSLGLFAWSSVLQWLVLTASALGFALWWQRKFGKGPLERFTSVTSRQLRRMVERLYVFTDSRRPSRT